MTDVEKVYLDILLSGAIRAAIEAKVDLWSGRVPANETRKNVQQAITNLDSFMQLFHK